MPGSTILTVNSVNKTFRTGRKKNEPFHVVRDVSFSVYPGEVYGLLGPNGAGKTTTIKMIIGLIQRDSGTIQLAGADPEKDAMAARHFGAVLEGSRNLYWRRTTLENLTYFGVLKGLTEQQATANGKDLLERFDLANRANDFVQTLSRGMQQKLAVLVSLVHHPKLVLLDEPTLGLDVEAVRQMEDMLNQLRHEGVGVLLSSHQLNFVEEVADRVGILANGQLVLEGATKDLLSEFAGDAYEIELAAPVPTQLLDALQDSGAIVDDNTIICSGNETLYEILHLIAPLPIRMLQPKDADLSKLFVEVALKGGEKRKTA